MKIVSPGIGGAWFINSHMARHCLGMRHEVVPPGDLPGSAASDAPAGKRPVSYQNNLPRSMTLINASVRTKRAFTHVDEVARTTGGRVNIHEAPKKIFDICAETLPAVDELAKMEYATVGLSKSVAQVAKRATNTCVRKAPTFSQIEISSNLPSSWTHLIENRQGK